MSQPSAIYYLTGMRGRLSEGLGRELSRRELEVSGRELSGEFQRLRFQEQVDTVIGDLTTNHWEESCRVLANSFGAYLFLHAQAQLPPYPGRVLLLSPIVGSFGDAHRMMGFIPPRSDLLRSLAESGAYSTPRACEIHVGANDWQSDPGAVLRLGALLGMKVAVVEGAGHVLPSNYVAAVLDNWLERQENA